MRKTLIVGAALGVIGGSALAQNQTPPAQQGPASKESASIGADF
jgi:hypothetical protein